MGVFIPTDVRLRDVLVDKQSMPFPDSEKSATTPNNGGLSYNFGTTEHKLYIVELTEPDPKNMRQENSQRLEIQFVPEKISIPREANLTEIVVVARNHPKLHYVNGKDTLTLNIEFYSDEDGHQDVYRKVQWLKGLTMNDGYQGKYVNVRLVFGELFKNEVWAVQSVQPTFSHFDADNGFYPLRAEVALNFILDPDKNLLISDVRL